MNTAEGVNVIMTLMQKQGTQCGNVLKHDDTGEGVNTYQRPKRKNKAMAPAPKKAVNVAIDIDVSRWIQHHVHDEEVQEIVPNLKPPVVPEGGTYITALEEGGVDQERIDAFQESKYIIFNFKPNWFYSI